MFFCRNLGAGTLRLPVDLKSAETHGLHQDTLVTTAGVLFGIVTASGFFPASCYVFRPRGRRLDGGPFRMFWGGGRGRGTVGLVAVRSASRSDFFRPFHCCNFPRHVQRGSGGRESPDAACHHTEFRTELEGWPYCGPPEPVVHHEGLFDVALIWQVMFSADVASIA